MSRDPPDRRSVLAGGAATLGSALLAGCDQISGSPQVQSLFDVVEGANLKLQRLLLRADQPAPEYAEPDISPWFKPNGSTDPADADYKQHAEAQFARWQLAVDGLVERPAQFTLAQLHAMPSRTQITRHDCVEGWSCIGKWTGVPLAHLLDQVGPKPDARYVVFHCADTMEGGLSGQKYYETIDLEDARHVQTILAYEMNGQTLPVPHGAPLRLRLERQLGYKMAKYVMRVELVDSFARFGDGRGGYWEDQGYAWYAGI